MAIKLALLLPPNNTPTPNYPSFWAHSFTRCWWLSTISIFFVILRGLSSCNSFSMTPNYSILRRLKPNLLAIHGKSKLPSPNIYASIAAKSSPLGLAPRTLIFRHETCRLRSIALFSTTNEETTSQEGASQESPEDSDNISQQVLYQQFKDLSLEIQRHDKLYYGGSEEDATNSDQTLISDDAFDALVRKEEELETNYPDLLEKWQEESGLGPAATRSGRVGTTATASNSGNDRLKRKHLTPMLSLDNVHTEEQLLGWLKRVVKAAMAEQDEEDKASSSMVTTIVTEPKLDGVSLSLRYAVDSSITPNDRKSTTLYLQWASTRGDGAVGQDVTPAANQLQGIPQQLELPLRDLGDNFALEVRGEVVMPRSEFLYIQKAEQAAKELQRKEDEENAKTIETSADGDSDGNNNEISETVDSKEAGSSTKINSSIVSFSNPRNAASGILLRKESDDPIEQAQSNELRSKLRFYAYDFSGLENLGQQNTMASESDGIQIRNQLSEWGFSLALPVAITNMEWKNPSAEDNNEIDDAPESSLSYDEWFQEIFVEKDQTKPIMEYFSALEEYRESLQEENENEAENNSSEAASTAKTSKKRNAAPSSKNYDWGDFEVDGCVHKVAQASIRSTMGYSMKSPKWATAHKFPAQSSVARLLDIRVQMGRTGALTPVAILEPTEVGGVTIQRATLHNFGHLQEILGNDDGSLEIQKYEPVLVQRAGDVIPQVVRRIKSSPSSSKPTTFGEDAFAMKWISLKPPEQCPFCASPVTYESSMASASSIGQVMRCNGPPLLCPPRAVTSLKHAFSRDALDLTGLSEARIQQLMDAGLLSQPSDIFSMGDDGWETLKELPGWGERSCKNLRDASERVASKGITLGRFIFSLGIRHLGKHTSELVASSYGSIGAFLGALENAAKHERIKKETDHQEEETTESTLSSLYPFPQLENKLGIGPVAIESLLEFSKTSELTDAAKALAESLTILEQDISLEETAPTDTEDMMNQPWKGFRVVFTGSLPDGLTRSRAQEIAKQLGAKATPGSVSKSTDLVVFGVKGGKKLTQARDLGIKTMEATDFVNMAVKNGFLEAHDQK